MSSEYGAKTDTEIYVNIVANDLINLRVGSQLDLVGCEITDNVVTQSIVDLEGRDPSLELWADIVQTVIADNAVGDHAIFIRDDTNLDIVNSILAANSYTGTSTTHAVVFSNNQANKQTSIVKWLLYVV